MTEKNLRAEKILTIESIELEAQGIAHQDDGKVVFVEGALPFERVTAHIHKSKKSFDTAKVNTILLESSQRVTPKCAHFGLHNGACGGCKMQHLNIHAQVAIKQRALEDNLQHIARVQAKTMMRPMVGPTWHYRFRARLSVRFVKKKNEVLIGFHERKSHFVADIKSCAILAVDVDRLLLPLRKLVAELSNPMGVPQIEVAVGYLSRTDSRVVALVLRHLEPLSNMDIDRLNAFAQSHPYVQWWLQPKGPDSIHLLSEAEHIGLPKLAYQLEEFGIHMPFRPTDFTQVNPFINQALVSRAIRLLAVEPHERVIDWFCGLGNFTLALATKAKSVLGVEGSDALVERARENYLANARAKESTQSILAPCDFLMRNLFEMIPEVLVQDGYADKWLIDPPRDGAQSLCLALAELSKQGKAVKPWKMPKRIVYVSCSPSTLARDAGILVHQAGYQLQSAGIVNMFPHTSHVESMAVFHL